VCLSNNPTKTWNFQESSQFCKMPSVEMEGKYAEHLLNIEVKILARLSSLFILCMRHVETN